MRVIGVTGYKNSGKTSLVMSLARELTDRGLTVSSVKHSSCSLDLPETDTFIHKEYAGQVAAITATESAIFFQKSMALDDMLYYLEADLILVEGFKKEKTFPKIVCLRPGDSPETLMDGLEICVVGASPDTQLDAGVPILDAKKDISKIADLVMEKAFKLPGMDCEACGYKTCYEMAVQIVNGSETIDSCRSLNADVQIKIDGRVMPAKPFISDMVGNTIAGMLSSLKGYRKGKIEIKIK